MLFRRVTNLRRKKREQDNSKKTIQKFNGVLDNLQKNSEEQFATHLMGHIGETVTIFTVSGGYSGRGFTGIMIFANHIFVRLIIRVGPWPSCSLGNSCNYYNPYNRLHTGFNFFYSFNKHYPINNLGAIVDIPASKIVAFSHNTI